MNDDWRLGVDVHDPSRASKLSQRLDASALEHELETAFRDRVIVSQEGAHLFCYAGTRQQAEAAERLIRSLAAEHGWEVECELARWHPEAEAWEDPDAPLPSTGAQLEAEHAARDAQEQEQALEQGYPNFEVRVECRSERDCAAFAERLEAEGLPVVRRGRYLVIGAADEDSAQAIAARCHREAPDGSLVAAEGSVPAVLAGSSNPFAIFGGLAG
ncbi:MAG TPA: hypothetical protein VE992_06170 [Solirubrobacteraceae bacterium]|nr:hypothetical protein [Solirubrobacteraceae bacterium]